MTKIRYKEDDKGTLWSTRIMQHPTNGMQVLASLEEDPEGWNWGVHDAHDNTLVVTIGKTKRKLIAMLQVRQALFELGFAIEKEKRLNRRKHT